jgi:hypothetical protein
MHRELPVFASFRPTAVFPPFSCRSIHNQHTVASCLPPDQASNANLTFFGMIARAQHWRGKQCHLLLSPCMQPQSFLGCPHQSVQHTWLLACSYHQTPLSNLLPWVLQVSLLCTSLCCMLLCWQVPVRQVLPDLSMRYCYVDMFLVSCSVLA